MSKDVLKFSVMLALAAVIWLPGMASADYVQVWSENGQYTNAQQTWDKAEAFLVSGGTWTEPGLTIAVTDWTATLINPTYALATGPAFDSSSQGLLSFTTTPPIEPVPILLSLTGFSGMEPPLSDLTA